LDTGHTDHIGCVAIAEVRTVGRADAGTARLRHNSRIDRNDVSHGKKGGQSGTDLGEEVSALPLPGMTGAIETEASTHERASDRRIGIVNPLVDAHDVGWIADRWENKIKEQSVASLEEKAY